MVIKLRRLRAVATVIAPYWPKKPWFMHLTEMATESVDMPPPSMTSSLRNDNMDTGGPSAWSVVAFRIPLRPRCC